ncbi:hypothetical protein LTR95_000273 [Oleoguttula sp. CCFEE 5521]
MSTIGRCWTNTERSESVRRAVCTRTDLEAMARKSRSSSQSQPKRRTGRGQSIETATADTHRSVSRDTTTQLQPRDTPPRLESSATGVRSLAKRGRQYLGSDGVAQYHSGARRALLPKANQQCLLANARSPIYGDVRVSLGDIPHRNERLEHARHVAPFSADAARDVYLAHHQRAPRTSPANTAAPLPLVTAYPTRRQLGTTFPQTVEQYYVGPDRTDAADAQFENDYEDESENDSEDDAEDDSEDDTDDFDEDHDEGDVIAGIDSPVYGRFSGVQAAYYSPQAREVAGTTYYRAQAQTYNLAPSQPPALPQPHQTQTNYTLAPGATPARHTRQLVARPARSDPASQTPRSMRRPSDADPPPDDYPPRRQPPH